MVKKSHTITCSNQTIFLRSIKYTKIVNINTHKIYSAQFFCVCISHCTSWKQTCAVEVTLVWIWGNATECFIVIKFFFLKGTHPDESWWAVTLNIENVLPFFIHFCSCKLLGMCYVASFFYHFTQDFLKDKLFIHFRTSFFKQLW